MANDLRSLLLQPFALSNLENIAKLAEPMSLRPLVELPSFPRLDTRVWIPQLEALRELNARWTQMFSNIQMQFRSLAPLLEEITKNEARCKRLEEAG